MFSLQGNSSKFEVFLDKTNNKVIIEAISKGNENAIGYYDPKIYQYFRNENAKLVFDYPQDIDLLQKQLDAAKFALWDLRKKNKKMRGEFNMSLVEKQEAEDLLKQSKEDGDEEYIEQQIRNERFKDEQISSKYKEVTTKDFDERFRRIERNQTLMLDLYESLKESVNNKKIASKLLDEYDDEEDEYEKLTAEDEATVHNDIIDKANKKLNPALWVWLIAGIALCVVVVISLVMYVVMK